MPVMQMQMQMPPIRESVSTTGRGRLTLQRSQSGMQHIEVTRILFSFLTCLDLPVNLKQLPAQI